MEKDNFDPRSPYMSEKDDPAQQRSFLRKGKSWRLSKDDREKINEFVEGLMPSELTGYVRQLEETPEFVIEFLDFDYNDSWNEKRERAVMIAFRQELVSYFPNNYLDLAALREAKAE